MSKLNPLAAAVIASAIAVPAVAQEHQQKLYINPSVGFQLFDDARDLSETATYSLGLEYRMLPRWAVEAVYSKGDADRKYVDGSSPFKTYRVDGLYYFADPEEHWNPYVSAGVGRADFGGNVQLGTAGTMHDETRVNVGAGARYNVSDLFSLRGELREFHGIDESTFDTVASIGFSLGFGRTSSSRPEPVAPRDSDRDGVTDNADQCAATPAGYAVDARGCELDGDRDGVVDRLDQCPGTANGTRVDAKGCALDSDGDGVLNSADQCPQTRAGAQVDATGCEGVSETIETIDLSVKFPTNSSVIGDRYDDEIRRVAVFMNNHPKTTVEIAGYTDSAGSAKYNQFLSQRRAESVARRLVNALGIDDGRVSAVGYGEENPIASNETADGRAKNRRVEAHIQVRR